MTLLAMQGESLSITRGDLLTTALAGVFAVHIVLLSHWAPVVGFESPSLLQIAAAPLVDLPAIHRSPTVIAVILVGGLLATALTARAAAGASLILAGILLVELKPPPLSAHP
ncbi:MAG: hypothetical protein ACKV2U_23205 [Bryobacteraceae bacterium]